MKYSAQILIRDDVSTDDIALKIGEALGIQLQKEESDFGAQYDWWDLNVYLLLRKNWYGGPVGTVNFDDYPNVVDLNSKSLDDLERQAWMRDIVQPIYQKLAALNCYHLALIEDLAILLDTSTPHA